jgi:nitrogen-specific signal transduction histidine kinase
MGKKPIYFMLARDLTRRNQVILDKIQQERLEAFALLSGGIAHDFNNYLSIIQGNISILDFYVRENMLDEGRDDVADIVSNVQSVIEQSKGLTKQLQSFSRTTLLQRKQINLDTLLSQIGKFMLTGTDIKLIYEYNSLNMFIEGDETMLSQVFTNLFINAREALEGRTEKIIELRVVDQDEAYLKIRVLDNGSGISEEDLPKVFEPFFSKKATGSGLGLSICQQIITEHGGNITVESMEDQFAEFIITLPISKVDSIDESDLADLPDIDPMDIWVMDDVPEIRRTLQHILELHGQRVECFATGEDLLKRLSRSNGPPQLLILDLTNKIGWGGHKTYSTLVEDQKLVIPTIFISGYSLEEFNLEQFGTNPVEFLHKPINEKLVLSTISKMIST